ncbi:tubulin gamma chain [[Candida] jaroonii]|uniref:Tubulin gamma chain n=1 Tax=[Candida] jaroonii TaxID=467808 RepID=A0ACA9Y886_9ASCO|nr:tubulin gamma chain [[Candida] jaroonii]
MPGETITLQAGQCGNQVGLEYWKQLSTEHGILADGTQLPYPQDEPYPQFEGQTTKNTINDREDRPELFFTLSDTGKYTPRSILVDLEPSVINKATNSLPMFNPRNIHLSETGSGAANNWQKGYSYGLEYQEELINLIDRECDKCENLSNFQLIHSVAGGTGSGVGSLLLELLSDRYGSKTLITTSSIFPSNEKTSDVVVQPYNTVLTLKRLIEFSDSSIIFDNDCLNTVESSLFGISQSFNYANNVSGYEGANKLISYVISSISNPIRFPSYMFTSIESIYSSLIPTPELKFLTASVAPFGELSNFSKIPSKYSFSNLNEYELILELLNDKYKMNRTVNETSYISMLTYVMGNKLNQLDINKGILKSQKRLDFVPWSSSTISVVSGKKSPFVSNKSKQLNGLCLSNNTSIISVLSKILKQYDLLAKREAYINYYTETNDSEERSKVMDMFNECKESVISVIEEYKNCRTIKYLEDDILEDEMM